MDNRREAEVTTENVEGNMPAGRLALALLCLGLPVSAAHAAVSETDFRMRNARDLIDLCSTSPNDPLAREAINFCQGFAVGVYQTLAEAQAGLKSKLFCLPPQTPTRNQAISDFVRWANTNPSVMSDTPADAVANYLIVRFPCGNR